MSPNPTLPALSFPNSPKYFETGQGRMAYVDQGEGPAIVFVHGMPTWSYLWRAFVGPLSGGHRCVAVDHLGFGRSDKPANADYHPRVLSEQLSALIDHLRLRDITLVVHDFGGPIGLGHAVRHPDNIARLAVFNTWMWPLTDHEGARSVDRAVKGAFGHVMYRWLNGSARWLVPRVLGKGNRLDPGAHRAYIDATRSSDERVGQLALARNLIGASDWYAQLWQARARLAEKPIELLWGDQDPTFGPEELQRWLDAFPHAKLVRFENAGHFVQEEAPARALAELSAFVG